MKRYLLCSLALFLSAWVSLPSSVGQPSDDDILEMKVKGVTMDPQRTVHLYSRLTGGSMRRTDAWLIGVVVAVGALGCARRPAVSAEGLALKRVVVYRNGVGYFERAGHIEQDKVFFKVKGSEVGDFLATLAVIEKGGSSVRSASSRLSAGVSKQRSARRLLA